MRLRLLAALALLVVPASASAATLPDQTLTKAGQVLRWEGKTTDPTGQGYGPPTQQTCTDETCDSFTLKVDVRPGTFPKGSKNPAPDGVTRVHGEGPTDMPGDGVLISVKWPTDFDQWNLFVEDTSTGQTVAQGFDLDSNAQSVLLPQPHNGTYKVWIVPFYTDFDKVDQNYRGEARVWLDPSQRHAKKTTCCRRSRRCRRRTSTSATFRQSRRTRPAGASRRPARSRTPVMRTRRPSSGRRAACASTTTS